MLEKGRRELERGEQEKRKISSTGVTGPMVAGFEDRSQDPRNVGGFYKPGTSVRKKGLSPVIARTGFRQLE